MSEETTQSTGWKIIKAEPIHSNDKPGLDYAFEAPNGFKASGKFSVSQLFVRRASKIEKLAKSNDDMKKLSAGYDLIELIIGEDQLEAFLETIEDLSAEEEGAAIGSLTTFLFSELIPKLQG